MTVSRSVIITDPLGLHARPAAEFVEYARTFASDVSVAKADKSGNAKSLLSVLKLSISQGSEITISATGEDETSAIDALVAILGRGAAGAP